MKRHFFYLMIFSMCLGVFPFKVLATGMPVFDASSFAQLIALLKNAQRQLQELKQQVDYLKEQKKSLNKLSTQGRQQSDFFKKTLEGNYGYGNLLNTVQDLQQRRWSNDSWGDVLTANGGGSSAFNRAQQKYDQLYPVQKPSDTFTTRHGDNLKRTYYRESSQISRSALAASSYSYDQINTHIKNLHDMLGKLENEKSEKAAIDLNTRLVAELGFIQLEVLRQQNIQTQLIATQTQGEVNGMSEQSQFMQRHH